MAREIYTQEDRMKIALASARIVDRDIPHNLSQMECYMKEAKAPRLFWRSFSARL